MASGINRDEIIEKMTLGTTTKIANKKKEMQKLQWKQDAYRNISDQILDISDKYASYASGSNLKDPMAFAKNIVSVHGKDEATQFITASGTSSLINNVSIKSVNHLATSTVRQSDSHISDKGIMTNLSNLNETTPVSKVEGWTLVFGKWTDNQQGGRLENQVNFIFPTSYEVKNDDGSITKVRPNYTPTDSKGMAQLAADLNGALKASQLKYGDKDLSDIIEFTYSYSGSGAGPYGNIGIKVKDGVTSDIEISTMSNMLGAWGYTGSTEGKKTISLSDLNNNLNGDFIGSSIEHVSNLDRLTGQSLTFNYDGNQKNIELITKEDAAVLKAAYDERKANGVSDEENNKKQMEEMKKLLQGRLDKAFGKDKVMASLDPASGELSFKTENDNTLSIVSNNNGLLKSLGLEYGSSNKVNMDGKLGQGALGLNADDYTKNDGTNSLDLKINGVAIEGLTTSSSIKDILNKINSNKEAGVKATYVDATGQFMLVANETGAGREISLDSNLAQELFGGFKKGADGKVEVDADGKKTYVEDEGLKKGQNAEIVVSYGNGVDVTLNRASNTFNLEGLNITVNGTFNSPVTFSAKADVDGMVEKVKGFFEEFNKLATDINNEIRTRPDSSYEPLTDEQKDEMDETSIENWEKKAKQGMLYGDSVMRDLSMDIQGIFVKLMENGASYEDLKEMGITYSEDWGDGGTLVFDEAAFRSAMEKDPDKVSNIFTGGGDMKKGLVSIVEDTFTPYATKYASKNPGPNGGSYGRLIEVAGSSKKPTTLMNNEIYKQLKEMEDAIATLQDRLKVEQDRYISQFTTMESLINKMNTQSSYLSQITG